MEPDPTADLHWDDYKGSIASIFATSKDKDVNTDILLTVTKMLESTPTAHLSLKLRAQRRLDANSLMAKSLKLPVFWPIAYWTQVLNQGKSLSFMGTDPSVLLSLLW
jgi:hypothetical protein